MEAEGLGFTCDVYQLWEPGDVLDGDRHEADHGWSGTRNEWLPWKIWTHDGFNSSWMRPEISVPTGDLVGPIQSGDGWKTNKAQNDDVFTGDLFSKNTSVDTDDFSVSVL